MKGAYSTCWNGGAKGPYLRFVTGRKDLQHAAAATAAAEPVQRDGRASALAWFLQPACWMPERHAAWPFPVGCARRNLGVAVQPRGVSVPCFLGTARAVVVTASGAADDHAGARPRVGACFTFRNPRQEHPDPFPADDVLDQPLPFLMQIHGSGIPYIRDAAPWSSPGRAAHFLPGPSLWRVQGPTSLLLVANRVRVLVIHADIEVIGCPAGQYSRGRAYRPGYVINRAGPGSQFRDFHCLEQEIPVGGTGYVHVQPQVLVFPSAPPSQGYNQATDSNEDAVACATAARCV